jgi:hypothetical protein
MSIEEMGSRVRGINRTFSSGPLLFENPRDFWQHSQYGLKYTVSPYARERMKTPFKRLENQNKN